MGQGDEIIIADANFPSASLAQRLICLIGLTATAVADALLAVMPLDDFAPEAAWRMEVVGDPEAEQPIFDAFRRMIADREGTRFHLAALERFAFYERVRSAFAAVATAGRRQTRSQAATDEALSSKVLVSE